MDKRDCWLICILIALNASSRARVTQTYPRHICVCVCVRVWSHISQGPLGLLGESVPTERGEKVFAVFVSRLAESPVGLYCKAIISGGVRDL